MDMENPIGIFDSGVGGLTVVREVIRQLPSENIVYFGDTARLPYGSKSRDTVIRYSKQIVNFLKTKGVKAVVVACNTASAQALDVIQEELNIPAIGVVKPGAYVAAQTTRNGNIGVIATEGTINTHIYSTVLHEYDPKLKVIGKACPLLVPLVEEGLLEDSVTVEIASRYLNVLKETDIDTLVLGCTHYPLIRKTIGKIMGDSVILVNPAYETARSLKKLLIDYGIYRSMGIPEYQFYVSDNTEKFNTFANSILPVEQLAEAGLVRIDNYGDTI